MAAEKKFDPFSTPPEPSGRMIGYARVSTADQNLDMQIAALQKAGVADQDIYSEHISAAAKKRPQYRAALKACRRGDTLVVWRFDRIGRDVKSLISIMEECRMRGVHIIALMERIDTTTPLGTLYFHISAAFAQFERDITRDRTRERMRLKKEKGEHVGPKMKLKANRIPLAQKMLDEGIDAKVVGKRLGVSRQTIYRRVVWPKRKK